MKISTILLSTTLFTLSAGAMAASAPTAPPVIVKNSTTPVEAPSALPPTCTPKKPNSKLSIQFVEQMRRQWPTFKREGKEPRVCLGSVCASCAFDEYSFTCWIQGPGWSCEGGCDEQGCWGGCQ